MCNQEAFGRFPENPWMMYCAEHKKIVRKHRTEIIEGYLNRQRQIASIEEVQPGLTPQFASGRAKSEEIKTDGTFI